MYIQEARTMLALRPLLSLVAGARCPRNGAETAPLPGEAALPEPVGPIPADPNSTPSWKILLSHMEQKSPTLREKCRNVRQRPSGGVQKPPKCPKQASECPDFCAEMGFSPPTMSP